jgi:polyhydroxyalkanoate synthesis regulator phasin
MTTNRAEEIREDIIERTAKNIPTRVQKDYVKTQIRIALNNYAVPFEKEIDELNQAVDNLMKARHELQEEVERLRKENEEHIKLATIQKNILIKLKQLLTT